jgi:hypothetical protein
VEPSCPWCRRSDFANWSAAKIHVKNCSKAPRPRWKDPRRGKILADFRPAVSPSKGSAVVPGQKEMIPCAGVNDV